MLRERLFSPIVREELKTEWRSRDISRIEGFSDAVFGFAVTLLVVALEVPRTSAELLETMQGFGSFLITFAILFSIWYKQFLFFRRYGLEDRTTALLNGALLVVVLFFVYPLKFIFSVMLIRALGGSKFVTIADGTSVVRMSPQHLPILFAIYGAGLAAVFLVFAFLYRHAYRMRNELKLSDVEAYDTRDNISSYCWVAVAGLVIALTSAAERMSPALTTGNGLIAISVVQLVAVAKILRVRSTRRRRREQFLAGLSADK